MPRLLRQPGPAALAVGLAITGTYFLCHGQVQTALYQVAGVLAAVTIAVATLVRRPTRSRHWWLLSVGLALSTAGDAVYWAISLVVGGDPPFPGPADAVYLTSSFLFVVAVALLFHSWTKPSLREVLDGFIVAGAAVLLLLQMLTEQATSQAHDWLPRLVAVAYPAMDILLLVALAQLVLAGGRRGFSFACLLAGGLVLFTADTIYGGQSLNGTYVSGSWLDAGWLLEYAFWGAAAADRSMTRLHEPVRARGTELSGLRLVFMCAATAVGPLVIFLNDGRGLVVLVGSLVMIALVCARMAFLFHDHTRAVRSLQEAETLRIAEQRRNELFEVAATTLECAVYERGAGGVRWSQGLTTVFGYALEDVDGSSEWWLERVHPDDRKGVTPSQASGSLEYRFRAADGRYREVWDRWKAVDDGHVIGGVVDVTDRRRLEGALRRSEKLEAIGTLAGGVAHDFNNLLMAIRAAAELASQRADDDREMRSLLLEIQVASDRGASLTQQLLAFSRQGTVDEHVIDLTAAVQSLEPMLERLLGDDLVVRTKLERRPLPVLAHDARIDQALINLAVNGRDAMPNGGVLTLSTCAVELDDAEAEPLGLDGGRYARLTVADTGVGMTAETMEQIFEPFFTTKEQGRGTGLGLATVYGIVTRSGGSISVESEVGRGTSFTVHLPLSDEPVVQAEPRAQKRCGGSETILVVEDEPVVRDLVVKMLRTSGYTVVAAADPEEALQMAPAEPQLDVLLTDMTMPGMNGAELAAALHRERPDLPVVYMSGFMDAESLDPDVRWFLQKPFAFADLEETVRAAIAGVD